MDLLNPVAGFLVGLLVGLTGVGGGALMTPTLVFLVGIAPQTAVGTDLLFATITKSFGTWVHGVHQTIDWQVFRRLCLGSLPAALLTLVLIHEFPIDDELNKLILGALGVTLALTGLAMLCTPQLHRLGRHLRTNESEQFKRHQPALTIAAGALIGFLVTLTSVGAGALGAVMLTALYPYRMTPTRLVGTDIAHAVPLTFVAGIGHMTLGNIDFGLLGGLLIGSIPGIILGAILAQRISGPWIRNAIAITLLLVASKILLQ